jgi:hypothetical protein
MALIDCPECEQQLSNSAASCPHCGYPIQQLLERQAQEKKQKKQKRRRRIFVFLIGIVAVGLVAFAAKQVHLKENQFEVTKKRETSLQELRLSDPKAYLAELKASNDPRWEREFKALDKQGYQSFVGTEITKLKEEMKLIAVTDIRRMLAVYVRLTDLDPENQEYKSKIETLTRQVGEENEKRKAR